MPEKFTENEIKDVVQLLIQASKEQEAEFAQLIGLLRGKLKEKGFEDGLDKIKEVAQSVNKNAHEKPWIFIAAAAFTGLVVGLICHKRQQLSHEK